MNHWRVLLTYGDLGNWSIKVECMCVRVFCVQKVSSEARPVWFVFSGMGAQWPNMGRDLMTLDCFRESIMRSDALMKPYGAQLYDILTNSTDDAFKSNINSAIGIVAIQVSSHVKMILRK